MDERQMVEVQGIQLPRWPDADTEYVQASGTAAGWPVADGADYRRMLVGDPGDYRRLGLDLARPTATRPYYLTEDELEDVRLVHQHS